MLGREKQIKNIAILSSSEIMAFPWEFLATNHILFQHVYYGLHDYIGDFCA